MHTGLSEQSGHIATGRPNADAGTQAITVGSVLRAAVLAAVAVGAANLLVYVVAAAGWGVPGGFTMFTPITITVTSAGGVVIAAVGLVVLVRLTRRAVPIFVAVAVGVTLLSLLGPVQAMGGALPGMPPASTATGITMILLHVLTGGMIAGLLPRLARR